MPSLPVFAYGGASVDAAPTVKEAGGRERQQQRPPQRRVGGGDSGSGSGGDAGGGGAEATQGGARPSASKTALAAAEALLAGVRSDDAVAELVGAVDERAYAMAVRERAHEGRCGWAACEQPLPELPRDRKEGGYRVSLREKAVYRNERATFCNARCALASARTLRAVRAADARRDQMDELFASAAGAAARAPAAAKGGVPAVGYGSDGGARKPPSASKPSRASRACGEGGKGAVPHAAGSGGDRSGGESPVASGVVEKTPAAMYAERAAAAEEAAMAAGARLGRGHHGAVEGYVPLSAAGGSAASHAVATRSTPSEQGAQAEKDGTGGADAPDKRLQSTPTPPSPPAPLSQQLPPQQPSGSDADVTAVGVATIELEEDPEGGSPTAFMTMMTGGGVGAGAGDADGGSDGGESDEDYASDDDAHGSVGGAAGDAGDDDGPAGARAKMWWDPGTASEREARASLGRVGFTALWVATQEWAAGGGGDTARVGPLAVAGEELPPPRARTPAGAELAKAMAAGVSRALPPLLASLRLPQPRAQLEQRVGMLLAALNHASPLPALGSRDWSLVAALLTHAVCIAGSADERGRGVLDALHASEAFAHATSESPLGADGRYRLLLQELVGDEVAASACAAAGQP